MSAARELAPRPVTAEELYNMPEDGRLYELWRGELRWMAPPGAEHGDLGQSLGARLTVFIDDHDLGRTFLAETGFQVRRVVATGSPAGLSVIEAILAD